MPLEGIWGWDADANKWRKVLVDSDGNLQVAEQSPITGFATETTLDLVRAELDGIETLLAGGLPSALDTDSLKVKEQSPITGFATSANQATLIDHVDGIEGLLAGGLPAALDSLALKVREQGTPSVHLYGYASAGWQTLLVESGTLKNLRVKLFDGDNGIDSLLLSPTIIADTKRGLITNAALYLSNNSMNRWVEWRPAIEISDNQTGLVIAPVCILGFDGSNWDRLRTYGTGILKVGRAEVGLSTARLTGTGQVGSAAAHKLFWVSFLVSTANGVIALADATAAGGTIVWECGGIDYSGMHCILDPPMEFSSGIYLETFSNLVSATFGYI